MQKKYFELEKALCSFSEDYWIPISESLNLVKQSIDSGLLDYETIKIELIEIINFNLCDWVSLVKNSNLLTYPENYSDVELRNYILGLLHDFLLPDKQLSEEKIADLSKNVIEILKQHHENDGWLFSYDLFDKLVKQAEWKDLEYYNLWKIDSSNIERKLETEEKDREIGFLRYRE
jgi:hypothetical protein